MGMSVADGRRDAQRPHLPSGDYFLGALRLPRAGGNATPELIYAWRFNTLHNNKACSALLLLSGVNDALLRTSTQLKLVLLGHVTLALLSSAEVNAPWPPDTAGAAGDAGSATGPGDHGRGRGLDQQEPQERPGAGGRVLKADKGANRGGFLHSLSPSSRPVVAGGRAYGFVANPSRRTLRLSWPRPKTTPASVTPTARC